MADPPRMPVGWDQNNLRSATDHDDVENDDETKRAVKKIICSRAGWARNAAQFLRSKDKDEAVVGLDSDESDDDEEDEEGEDNHKELNRDLIRRKLAAAGTTSAGSQQSASGSTNLQENNLLVCFMNDLPSSEDCSFSGSDTSDHSPKSFDIRNCSAFARANISRKKEHVIIPINSVENLVCSEDFLCDNEQVQENPLFNNFASHSGEDDESDDQVVADDERINEEEEEEDKAHLRNNLQFFEQLALIQNDARKKLKVAQVDAHRTIDHVRKSRDVKVQVIQLLRLKEGSDCHARLKNGGRKLNRKILTEMNVGQLQVVLNFFLSQIETLNEDLVKHLMERDELIMEQDSLLTDVEDITKCISSAVLSPMSEA